MDQMRAEKAGFKWKQNNRERQQSFNCQYLGAYVILPHNLMGILEGNYGHFLHL